MGGNNICLPIAIVGLPPELDAAIIRLVEGGSLSLSIHPTVAYQNVSQGSFLCTPTGCHIKLVKNGWGGGHVTSIAFRIEGEREASENRTILNTELNSFMGRNHREGFISHMAIR